MNVMLKSADSSSSTAARGAGDGGTALSVVVPTFNERDNVHEMVARLDRVLGNLPWEVIFVDDASPDGTSDLVREIGRHDGRVRLISRHGRRGLSSAVIEGAMAAAADVVAVMDGDLQHDESVLPELYETVASGRADIASASRFLQEDGAAGLSSDSRLRLSNTGIRLANQAFGLDMSDPLTGFFAMRRQVVVDALPYLSGQGFKVLLDLITAPKERPRVVELPFKFRPRLHGESKLSRKVMYDFFLFFLEKKIRPFVPLPARFISFGLINGVGIGVHLLVLLVCLRGLGMGFIAAQLAATFVAMTFNYTLNNLITYNDIQLKGADFYRGFVLFSILCSFGVIANVGVAEMIHLQYENLFVLPSLAGAVITMVWNYAATKAFVWSRSWRRDRRAAPIEN